MAASFGQGAYGLKAAVDTRNAALKNAQDARKTAVDAVTQKRKADNQAALSARNTAVPSAQAPCKVQIATPAPAANSQP
jgi:hypothetical protein